MLEFVAGGIEPVVVIEVSIGAVALAIIAALYFRAAREKSRPQEPADGDEKGRPDS